jgi:hypothetical protein
MEDILSDMKKITTREVQKETRAVRQRLLAGETLEWVMGKETVGYLTPARPAAAPEPWPDLLARLEAIHGKPEREGEPAARTIYDDRD